MDVNFWMRWVSQVVQVGKEAGVKDGRLEEAGVKDGRVEVAGVKVGVEEVEEETGVVDGEVEDSTSRIMEIEVILNDSLECRALITLFGTGARGPQVVKFCAVLKKKGNTD